MQSKGYAVIVIEKIVPACILRAWIIIPVVIIYISEAVSIYIRSFERPAYIFRIAADHIAVFIRIGYHRRQLAFHLYGIAA